MYIWKVAHLGKKPWEVWPWESTKNLLVFYDFSELEFIKFQRTIFFSLIYCIQCKLYYWNSEKKNNIKLFQFISILFE